MFILNFGMMARMRGFNMERYLPDSSTPEYILIGENFHVDGRVIYQGSSLEEALAWSALYETNLEIKTFFGISSASHYKER